MKAKVGSKVHKSTAIKPKAGLIEFKGLYVKGLVWSNDGVCPTVYNNEAMANKMAERRGLEVFFSPRGGCYYLIKE